MDAAPELGVGGPPTQGLTIEGWFRKEGLGATASSGVGGIVVQPLFAKGRGGLSCGDTSGRPRVRVAGVALAEATGAKASRARPFGAGNLAARAKLAVPPFSRILHFCQLR